MRETRIQSQGQEDILEKGKATHSVFLLGEYWRIKSWKSSTPCLELKYRPLQKDLAKRNLNVWDKMTLQEILSLWKTHWNPSNSGNCKQTAIKVHQKGKEQLQTALERCFRWKFPSLRKYKLISQEAKEQRGKVSQPIYRQKKLKKKKRTLHLEQVLNDYESQIITEDERSVCSSWRRQRGCGALKPDTDTHGKIKLLIRWTQISFDETDPLCRVKHSWSRLGEARWLCSPMLGLFLNSFKNS